MLPAAQMRLWPQLVATPSAFTLYGGTAIALRLGHRPSVDFDFFATDPFVPRQLRAEVSYLAKGRILQEAPNTLTMLVGTSGPVQVSFFGGLRIGQVSPAEPVEGPGFAVAALLDLAGTKAAVVTQRAEAKDYLDLHALLTIAGIDLPTMLSAAAVIYGEEFNPLVSLKAISYHDDPSLSGLSAGVKRDLVRAVRAVDHAHLPMLSPFRKRRPR